VPVTHKRSHQCWRGDLVGVALDTFNDGQRSLMFVSNPLGA